jgi:hypothetical protein
MPRSSVLAILPNNDSIKLSHDPWVGVKTNFETIGHAGQVRKCLLGDTRGISHHHTNAGAGGIAVKCTRLVHLIS